MTGHSLYRRMLLAAGSVMLSMNIGCASLKNIGEGIYHNGEVYVSRLEHSHDIDYKLLDGTTHTIEIAGHNHHHQSKRIAPVFEVLQPEMVRSIERLLFWKKSEFRDPKLVGDAHYILNDANICLREDWESRHLVHESAHLFMRTLDSDTKKYFEKIGKKRYEQNLADPDIGLLSTKWGKNPIQAESGPFYGFISAYASNSPSECFAELMEHLFVLTHPELDTSASPRYFFKISKTLGTDKSHHHHLQDHDRRIEHLRDIGALTDKMYIAYRSMLHPVKLDYALGR